MRLWPVGELLEPVLTPHYSPVASFHLGAGKTIVRRALRSPDAADGAVGGSDRMAFGNVSAAYHWEKIPAEHIGAKPESAEATEAGAEVLLAKRHLSFSDSGISNEDFHRTIIYDERAAESVGRIKIIVNRPAVLDDCGARVTRADGTVREYAMKDFSRTKAVERGRGGGARSGFVVDDNDNAVLVSGADLYQLVITDLRPGDLVEYYQRIDENMDALNGYAG